MKELLNKLNFDQEEIIELEKELMELGYYRVKRFIDLLIKYNCQNSFIKEILISRKDIIKMDLDRIEYLLESIIANDDIIEVTLLELV